MNLPRALIGLVLLTLGPASAAGQEDAALRVFLDCQGFYCDFDHFRREIGFVNWMRDRQDAQVHVLGTAVRTGSGGREYTFTFLGQGAFRARSDTLRYASSQVDTDAEVRDGLTRTLALGLVRYAAATSLAPRLGVRYTAPDSATATVATGDPWNYWVFRVRVGGSLDGESRQNAQSVNGSVSANRVTEGFKLELGARGRYSRSAFDLDDTTRFVSTSRNWEFEGLAVGSLGPHWSVGGRWEVSASTFFNQDFALVGGPALEFNVFPYGESTRRLLTFTLTPAIAVYDYEQETIFDRTSEMRALHLAEVGFVQQQPWGEIHAAASWWQYWHDLDRQRLELFTGLQIRLIRGLSLNVFGEVARVKDQIYLPKEDLTPEEILVRRRQLGTDFRYFVNVGLSYTFGSIYNNIVNPRIER